MKRTFSIFFLSTFLYLGVYGISVSILDSFNTSEIQELQEAGFSALDTDETPDKSPGSGEEDESDSVDEEPCCFVLKLQDNYLRVEASSGLFYEGLYSSFYLNKTTKPPKA